MKCRYCGKTEKIIKTSKCAIDQQFEHHNFLDSQGSLNNENIFCKNCGYQYSVDSIYIESSLKKFLDSKLKFYESNLLIYLLIEELLLIISMFLIEPNWLSDGLGISFIITTYVCHLIINLSTLIYSIYLCQKENTLNAFVNNFFTKKNFVLLVFGNCLLFICNFIHPIMGIIFESYFYLHLLKKLLYAASKTIDIPIVSDFQIV